MGVGGKIVTKRVHLIHGFNERHKVGEPRISVLKEAIEARGFECRVHDYGHWDLIATRNNSNLARVILPSIKEGDTLIGFSNGAAIIAHLCRLGAPIDKIIFIQPALSKKWAPPKRVKCWTVFYNKGDLATVAGKHWRRVTGVLPWRWQQRHHWGEMGNTGYKGKDTRVIQYRTDKVVSPDLPLVTGHSGWARAKSAKWWEFIVQHA